MNKFFITRDSAFFDDINMPWSEFCELCDAFGDYLKNNSIDEIEIFLTNCNEFLIVFFGALSKDIIVKVLPEASDSILSNYIDDVKFINIIKKLTTTCCSYKNSIEVSMDSKFYLKTSGSSGNKKLIEKSISQMVKESEALKVKFNISSNSVFFASVSHQHMFGITFKIFLPLISGAKVICKELNYPESIFELEAKDYIFITSPVLIKSILLHPNFKKMYPLSRVFCAGSKLKEELRLAFNRVCDDITEIYGSTETGIIAYSVFNSGLTFFDEVEFALEDEFLSISSPWCSYFKTGDIVEVSGRKIKSISRADRIVKLNDKRYSLEEIEQNILKNDIVADVYTAIHPKFNRVVAILKLSRKGVLLFKNYGRNGVLKSIKSGIDSNFRSVVRFFKFVKNIPRNSQSKVLKQDIDRILNSNFVPEIKPLGNFKYQIKLNYEQFYFDGHFQDIPVLPGFVMLDFVKQAILTTHPFLNNIVQISNLKFQNFIRSDDELTIKLDFLNDNTVSFEIMVEQKVCSKGKIQFER